MFKKFMTVITTLLFVTSIQAKDMNLNFTPDPNVSKLAEAFSLDCVDFVGRKFNLILDWSDESIFKLEPILANLSNYARASNMPAEQVNDYAKIFGFYIGEVYRKNHADVVWGGVEIDGRQHFALGTKENKPIIWPVTNVSKRIYLGEEANIATYYSAVVGKQ
ncbi:DUF3806 domain-containing protein [Shewanella sp. SP2S2-4]|uniref:DUF3806 domain-containing protein n=1 Tax=Shewanella TaxID=22 RepID=UPI00014F8FE2|nr:MULTISPECIES: DUF3806 domain-containing protein [Shewanella]ABS06309.1 conserved hypothetical protein [Shewanella baltica OS185]MDT3275027.1 DUF3806 domain-containing protein [Shewanella sp. SP2S2-4]MDT3322011.1 DUF3806 domain-containing protein [Shewanella sp. SP1S2-4]